MRLSALTLQMKCQAQEVATLLAARGDAIRGCEEIPGPSWAKSAEQRKEQPAGIPGRYSEELRRRDATAI